MRLGPDDPVSTHFSLNLFGTEEYLNPNGQGLVSPSDLVSGGLPGPLGDSTLNGLLECLERKRTRH